MQVQRIMHGIPSHTQALSPVAGDLDLDLEIFIRSPTNVHIFSRCRPGSEDSAQSNAAAEV